MEADISESLEEAAKNGERLETLANKLADHCCAYQQLANLYSDWLEELGDVIEVDPPSPEEKKKGKKGKQKGKKKKEEEETKEEPPPAEPTTSGKLPIKFACWLTCPLTTLV